jgi:hypothetical protein
MGGGASVWVVAGEQVERREVATGVENAERVEILSGLREGEQVVRRGQEGLYAGARVADAAAGPAPAAGHSEASAPVAPAPPGAARCEWR